MLVGIVSSKRLTDQSSIRTMSGLAWVHGADVVRNC